ncbi:MULTISPECIES: hypothetical protein [Photorhabdus]|nr:hypothetical protein [Photorhabdus heterorhabditis]
MITTYNNCIYQKVEQERSTNTRIPQPAVGMVQKHWQLMRYGSSCRVS